jgi:phosphoglycolate phosphatase
MAPAFAPIDLVLFDLDGTLIDSAPDLCAAVAFALAEVGLPPHDVDAVRRMIGEGQRILIERAVHRAAHPAGSAPADVDIDDVLRRFRAYYSDHLVVRTTLYPGVAETLAALGKTKDLPLAVATNKPGAWARRIIEHFGLLPYFGDAAAVLGEDDVGARKPDPRLIQHHCDRLGIPVERTLLVGDSAIDWQAAARAGCQFAYCTYGFGDSETAAAVSAAADRRDRPRGSTDRPYILATLPDLLQLPGIDEPTV